MNKINSLLKENKLSEAIVLLSQAIEAQPLNAEALFLRGKVYWKLGQRAKAVNDYAAAADIDPNSPAVQALEQAKDIERFFNPDLLNP